MVVLETAAFLGLTGLILWVIGWFILSEETAAAAVGFIGGVIVLGVGSLITTDGLSFKTGRVETLNSTTNTTVVEFSYSSVTTPTQLQLGALVMIASFVLIYLILMKAAEKEG